MFSRGAVTVPLSECIGQSPPITLKKLVLPDAFGPVTISDCPGVIV
eukprot:SAG31_NODE_10215_length_1169_cov_1.772897_3_plen_45_part_01